MWRKEKLRILKEIIMHNIQLKNTRKKKKEYKEACQENMLVLVSVLTFVSSRWCRVQFQGKIQKL